jgi:hypothetical protein
MLWPLSRHGIPFWETLFNLKLLKVENLILGGDLNFSLREAEIWGPSSVPEPTHYQDHSLLVLSSRLLDITPKKLLPT